MTFIGSAGWNRTQLLGEISRRSWLLCRGKMDDLYKKGDKIYRDLYDSGTDYFF